MIEFERIEVIRFKEEGSDVQIKVVFGYVGSKIDNIPVLGFWVDKKPNLEEGRGGFYTVVDEWQQPTYLSYHTSLPITTERKKIKVLAQKIADKIIKIAPDIESPMPMMVGKMDYLHCDPNWEKWIKELNIIVK